jgi:hypothetical protein
MKKEYMRPQTKVVKIKSTRLLAGSAKGVFGKVNPGTVQEEVILQFGGIDDDGDLDPE